MPSPWYERKYTFEGYGEDRADKEAATGRLS
jgi:hypothetical protein